MAIASSCDSASADVITESFSITSTIHVSLPDVLYFAFIKGYLLYNEVTWTIRAGMNVRSRPTREATIKRPRRRCHLVRLPQSPRATRSLPPPQWKTLPRWVQELRELARQDLAHRRGRADLEEPALSSPPLRGDQMLRTGHSAERKFGADWSRVHSQYPAPVVAFHTGLRSAELRTLQWRRIDLLEAHLTVGKSKTAGGEGRIVPLSATALGVLKEWRARFPDAKPAH
jgi:integrase